MMAGSSNDKWSSSVVCSDDPPPLSITLKELRDLPNKLKRWDKHYPPVDILLLTVEDCEFLACYHYLRDSFKSFEKSIGFVYFGKMGDNEDESLKVALVKRPKESLDPKSTQTAFMNTVTLLRPKATFLVGFCYGLNPDEAQLGDVVIPSKVITDFLTAPVSRNVSDLISRIGHGWEAPLEDPEERSVRLQVDGAILCDSDLIFAKQVCRVYSEVIAFGMEQKGENYSQGYSCLASVIIV